jgi:chemotaxis regulatin CheY-phosphate phosphatase CheZ
VAAERDLAAWLPDLSSLTERAEAQRKRVVTAAEAFAPNQEQLARALEELAARRPGRREEYRRGAEEARSLAHQAHEFLRALNS